MGGTTAPVTGSGSCPAWMARVSKPWVMPSRLSGGTVRDVSGCLFCAIVAGDRPSFQVASTDESVAFLDIRPVFKGHVLVVPRKHVGTLPELPVALLAPYIGFEFWLFFSFVFS